MKNKRKLLRVGAWTLLAAVLVAFNALSGSGNSESLAATSQKGKIQEDMNPLIFKFTEFDLCRL